jgi:predicted RNA-binding protein with PIN domain
MATEIFIIDAYNLLRRGFDFAGRDLQSQREMLEVQLREFLRARPQARLFLVYDGALEVNPTALRGRTESLPEGLQIHYTTPPETADDVVLKLCRRLIREGRTTVVTSDFKDIVRQLPARIRHRSSEEFAMFLEDVLAGSDDSGVDQADTSKEDEKPSQVSAEEVAEWTEAFSRPTGKRRRRK